MSKPKRKYVLYKLLNLCLVISISVSSFIFPEFIKTKVSAAPQTVELLPLDDTHVKEAYPTSTYNTVTSLISDGSPKVITLLKFDVSSIAGANVTAIQLKIKPTSTRSLDKDIMLVTNSWTSSSVNWNTRPTFNSNVADYVGNVTSGVEFSINLNETPIVSNWGSTLSLAIDDNVNGEQLTFNSKEHSTPGVKLVVTYDNTPTAPEAVLSNGAPSGTLVANTTNTNLTLNSDIAATCKYDTSSTFDYITSGILFTTTGGTSHSTNISGLTAGSSYTYYVKCQTTAGTINANSLTISFNIANYSALVASFTKSTTGGVAPVSINFDAIGSTTDSLATITNYAWNFGDSTTASGVTTSKTYSTGGNYTVTLTVTDSLGRNNSTSQTVNVTNPVFIPVLSNGAPSGALAANTTSTNLTLNTDIAATCKYSSSNSFNYATEGTVFTTTGSTSHSSNISGLTNGSTYNYYVKCQSTSGGINSASLHISFNIEMPVGTCAGVDLNPANYTTVVNGTTRTTKLSYTSKNSILILNTTINLASSDHGIYLKGSSNVTIANSVINGAYGEKQGIYIDDSTNVKICNTEIYEFANGIVMYGTNSNVLIQSNNIHNTNKNGILARQNEGTTETTTNLQIINNNLNNVAQVVQPTGSASHGMYIQVREFLITGNTVTNVNDSHGISVRSSGLITNNTVSNTGASSVAYYPDHTKGISNSLYIENNTFSLSGQRDTSKELVELVSFNSEFDSYVIDNFYIRYNQLTPDNNIGIYQRYIDLGKNIVISPNY